MPTIHIDTSMLGVRTFRIDGLGSASFDGSTGVDVDLAPGSYTFTQLNTNAQIPFAVTAAGTLWVTGMSYVHGDGTNTLTVHGFPITIDGRSLSHDLNTNWYYASTGSNTLSRNTTHQVNLLPLNAPAYVFSLPSGDRGLGAFNVTSDGAIEVDSLSTRVFAVSGNILTVVGFPITVDGRGLPYDLDTGGWYRDDDGSTILSRTTTHQVTLMPLYFAMYRFWSPAGEWGAAVFNVEPDGSLDVNAVCSRTFAVSGTTLTVTGFPITIDGTAVPHDLDTGGWYVDDTGSTALSRTTTHQVTLLPLQSPAYRFLSPAGEWTAAAFNVTLDGSLDVDDQYAQTFAGTGGDLLTVSGVPLTIDGTLLSHDLDTDGWYVDDTGSTVLSHTTAHQICVLPLRSPAYRFRSIMGVWSAGAFNVSADGQVLVDPEYQLMFQAGQNTLNLTGGLVNFDAMGLPHDLMIPWGFGDDGTHLLSRARGYLLTVLPLQTPAYRFMSPTGAMSAGVFNIGLDGTLQVDPEYAQTFVTSANNRMTVTGFPFTIDGRSLPHDLDTGGWYRDATGATTLSRTTTNQVTLLPLEAPAYRFLTPAASWTDAVFNVSPDGQLQVAPRHARTFAVNGDLLTVNGYAVRIDARGLAHSLSLDGFAAITPQLTRNQTLVLLPLMVSTPYILRGQPAQTPTYRFVVNNDGTVTQLDPGPALIRTEPASGRLVSELRRALTAAEIAYDRFDYLVNAGPTQAATYGAQRTAAQQNLTAARAALSAAATAQLPLWPGDDPLPILLWPMRIEVRYYPNAQHPTGDPALAIRVIPDDIAISTFESEFTDAEYQAAQTYWTTVTAAGATDGDKSAAWSTILAQLGPARAAWAVEAMHPTVDAAGTPHFPDVGHRDSTWTRPAASMLLPDHFIFRGWRNDTIAFEVVGNQIPADLTFGPDPVELSGDQPPPFGWATGAAWMVDFDKAVTSGMGVLVPLDGPDVTFDEIIVLGVTEKLADDATDQLARTLQGHLYTDGMTFPASDAPTNNTPGTRSDWTSAPTMRTPDQVATAVAAEDPTSGQPAVALADALGFTGPATPGQPGRRDLLAALGGTDRDDERDFQRSWQVYQILQGGMQLDPHDTDAPIPFGWLSEPDIAAHFTSFVRPRGPLPPLRIGRQPYGILPITSLALWNGIDDTAAVPALIADRLRGLHGFLGRFLPLSPRVGRGPDQDEVLMDLLRRLPESVQVVFADASVELPAMITQRVLPDLFANLIWQLDTEVPFIPGPVTLAARGDQLQLPVVTMAAETLTWLDDFQTALDSTPAGKDSQPPPLPDWVTWANSGPDALAALGLFAASTLVTNLWALWITSLAMAAKYQLPNPTQAQLDQADAFIAACRKPIEDLAQLADWISGDQGVNDRLLANLIEAQTSRVDAWATSLATVRLHTLRTSTPAGIRVGAYGWLVDVAPAPGNADAGWVMTPSIQHAATAAVLHSGWAAHTDPAAFAVDLNSARVRKAVFTLAAIRLGQTLEELLGYQLERALHDNQADDLIAPLRAQFPLPPADPTLDQAGAPTGAAEHGQRLVVDGNAARLGGAAFIRQADTLPVGADGSITFPFPPDAKAMPSSLAVLPSLLLDLDDTVDAIGDVLLAESVHHLVAGSPLRAGLTADTVGKAAPVPDTFDVLTTPGRYVAVSHTVALALAVGAPTGWPPAPSCSRAALDPAAEALAAWALGPPSSWTATITAADGTTTASTLADVAAGALDVVVEATDPIDISALAARIRFASGADGTVTIGRGDGLGADTALPVLAAAMRAVLGGARPAAAAGAALSPTSPGSAADLAAVAQRVTGWWQGVTTALAAWPDGAQAAAIAALAAAGVSGVRFDTPVTVGPALQQRLQAFTPPPPPTPNDDPVAWLAKTRDAVAAVVGGWFTAAPLWASGAADWAELGGGVPPGDLVDDDDVDDWLSSHRDVRAGVTALCDAVDAVGAVGAGLPGWAVRQSPLTPTAPALTGWVAREHPGRRSALHLAALHAGAPDAPSRVLLLVDQWVENVPAAPPPRQTAQQPAATDPPVPDQVAGLGFRFDRPDARAPQALLLALPPDLTRGWTLEDLHAAVDETLWWARARPLDGTDLPELRWILG